jgi:hypothetical protein
MKFHILINHNFLYSYHNFIDVVKIDYLSKKVHQLCDVRITVKIQITDPIIANHRLTYPLHSFETEHQDYITWTGLGVRDMKLKNSRKNKKKKINKFILKN